MYFKTFISFCVVQIIQYSYGQQDHFYRHDYTYLKATESFYKIHTISRKWLEAMRLCANEGAQLFFPDNQYEKDTVLSYFKETHNIQTIHVGLSDILSEGVFETVDGKKLHDLPHTWHKGEPNDANGGEDCVDMLSDGSMNDIPCSDTKQPFICKRALATLQWNHACNMAFLDYSYNETLGRCYKFHTNPVRWSDAHALCAAEQVYLAVINSQQEADYLVELTKQKHKIKTGDYVRDIVFLGFHNLFDEGWTTVKGTSVKNSGYDSWGPGQPDDANRDKCGSMFYDGQLNDIACYKKSFFICEHEITLSTTTALLLL